MSPVGILKWPRGVGPKPLRVPTIGRAVTSAIAIAALLAASSQPVLGLGGTDPRCFRGPGIQVWRDTPLGSESHTYIMCGSNLQITDLFDKAENNSGARWADTISAWQTFNMPSNQVTSMYEDPCRHGTSTTVTGNATVSYSSTSYMNDKISSVSSPNFAGPPC